MDDCATRAADAHYTLLDSSAGVPFHDALRLLDRMRSSLEGSVGAMGGKFLLNIAETLFRWGVTYSQAGDYRAALNMNREARRPLAEAGAARRRCGVEELLSEVQELEESLAVQLSSAESAQARQAGDDLLEQGVRGGEELSMDAVYAAIDRYKEAAVLTREHDLEAEAIALSRLGRVYRTVLREDAKARNCFRQAVNLAVAMAPRTFYREEWYSEAQSAILQYQAQDSMREEEKRQAAKDPILKSMEKELAAVRAASADSPGRLLTHIYTHHPPPSPEHRLAHQPTDNGPQMKALLKTSLVHYHPDKAA